MAELSGLHLDCRHFRFDRPCDPHKSTGVTCEACQVYQPIRHRVLIVKLAAVGDVLRTTSLLPAIQATWPDARITWLTAPSAKALFQRNPRVDEVLTYGDARALARIQVEQFDVVLCPDADPEAASLAAAAHARERRGFTMDAMGHVVPLSAGADHWFRMGLSDAMKRANRSTYQELIAAVLDLPLSAVSLPELDPAPSDLAAVAHWRAQCPFEGPWIGLNTGAGGRWVYKRWTSAHQQEFLRLATDAGYGVLLLGGPEERDRHLELQRSAAGRPVFDAGTTNSFQRFAAFVDLCQVVVTGDTFALHVSTARRKPTIALFGPTSSAEIELYGLGEKIEPTDLDCLCCYLPICEVDPHCQQRILPERVMASVMRWAPQKTP